VKPSPESKVQRWGQYRER